MYSRIFWQKLMFWLPTFFSSASRKFSVSFTASLKISGRSAHLVFCVSENIVTIRRTNPLLLTKNDSLWKKLVQTSLPLYHCSNMTHVIMRWNKNELRNFLRWKKPMGRGSDAAEVGADKKWAGLIWTHKKFQFLSSRDKTTVNSLRKVFWMKKGRAVSRKIFTSFFRKDSKFLTFNIKYCINLSSVSESHWRKMRL